MELSQILLENTKEWPEHVQILESVYNAEPRRAYEKVKELAQGIEQPRAVFGKGNTKYEFRNRHAWKERAREYEKGRPGVKKPYKLRSTECVGGVERVQREERVEPDREWRSRQGITSEQMSR
ncbi:hypothetical protein ANCDUO_06176 [Ancylostoma duodenale]|uniref:Uncharacterized protein n=1 Tax=Ancylostoma duodenale TaxID=51022 RepID=A0A0C2GWS1_9BILA|nr:hypothetical protein ANCDUO_06176 [Ancylostoma duodenale]